jgi:hypothetical protein
MSISPKLNNKQLQVQQILPTNQHQPMEWILIKFPNTVTKYFAFCVWMYVHRELEFFYLLFLTLCMCVFKTKTNYYLYWKQTIFIFFKIQDLDVRSTSEFRPINCILTNTISRDKYNLPCQSVTWDTYKFNKVEMIFISIIRSQMQQGI